MPLKSISNQSSFIQKHGFYFILAIAFVPALINVVTRAYGPVENYGWNILYYHVGYETGFGGRKLLASFCHLIFPDFVKLRHIRAMAIAINFIMVGACVLFLGRCFRRSKNSPAMWTVTVLYLLGPFSIIAFMSIGLSVAFAETYQIALTILWVLLWTRYRGEWPFYIATLLVAVTCCLLHHTFCCTLFPVYVGLFIYDIINHNSIKVKETIGYGIICIVLLGLLVIIWKFSQMTVSIDQLNEWFKSHAAVDAYECSREAHVAYYYQSNAENRANVAHLLTWEYRYGELFLTILLLSPLLIAAYYPWIRASHTAPTKLSSWRYRVIWILMTLLTLPIFFMATDYNRWFVCYFFSLFAVTVALISLGDRALCAATSRMYRWFAKHPIIATSLAIYIISFHCTPFDQTKNLYGLQEAMDLWDFLKGL